jgi:hypothetical protein
MSKVLAIPAALRGELAERLQELNVTRKKFAEAGLDLRVERTRYDPEYPSSGEFVGAVTLFDYVHGVE